MSLYYFNNAQIYYNTNKPSDSFSTKKSIGLKKNSLAKTIFPTKVSYILILDHRS